MALTISSTSDYVTQGTVAIPTTGSMAIWFKPTWAYNDGVDHCIFRVRNDTGSIHLFDFVKDSLNRWNVGWCVVGTSDTRVIVSASGLVQNAWNHVCLTWTNAGTSTLYLAGSSIGTAGSTLTWSTSGTNRIIGKDEVANGFTAGGDASDPAIWNTVLSTADITSLSKGWVPNKVSASSLVDYLTLQTTTIGGTNWAGGTAGTVNGCANATGPPCNLGLPEIPIILPPQKAIQRASFY